jgi:hypothetical protein
MGAHDRRNTHVRISDDCLRNTFSALALVPFSFGVVVGSCFLFGFVIDRMGLTRMH